MKATDLMIGDCVYFDIKKDKVCKITGIRIEDNDAYAQCDLTDVWYRVESYEPIPLTPEILEKNGFGFVKTDEEYRRQSGVWTGYWIYKGLELGVANLNHVGNWPCCINIYDSNIECKYVHQLQHALRLCQIEKEIIL